jgi:hypothetical protein
VLAARDDPGSGGPGEGASAEQAMGIAGEILGRARGDIVTLEHTMELIGEAGERARVMPSPPPDQVPQEP